MHTIRFVHTFQRQHSTVSDRRRLLQADTYSDTWKNASAVGFISWWTSHVQDCFAWRRRRRKIRSVILCACHYNAATRRLTKGIHGQTSCEHPYSETILIFSQKSLPEWVFLTLRSFSNNLYCSWIRVRGVSWYIANGVETCLLLASFSLVNYKMLGIPQFCNLFVCGKRLHFGCDFLSVVYRVLPSDNLCLITVIRWENKIYGAIG